MSDRTKANAKIMKQLSADAGISESKSIALQTESKLMTLEHLKRVNPQVYGHLPRIEEEMTVS